MGANSKQRREAKKRRAQLQHQDRQRRGRESDPYPPGSSPFQAGQAPGPGQPTDAHRANGAVSMATAAIRSGDEDLLHHALDLLVALPERHGQRVGCTVVESVLMLSIRGLWSQGWQPLDAPHIVGKLLGPAHRNLLVEAIGIECRTAKALYVDERWRQQLVRIGAISDTPDSDTDTPDSNTPDSNTPDSNTPDSNTPDGRFDAGRVDSGDADTPRGLFPTPRETRDNQLRLHTDLRLALEIIESISRLPRLPLILPPPGAKSAGHLTTKVASARLDDKILDRVRALLAKAESTTFEEEAGALTTKAQELMARHAIDLAMLDSRSPTHEGASARRIHIDDPYTDAKCSLLSSVAAENRCRAISTASLGFVTVFGFESDLDIVELLFTSLLTQATTAMIAAGSTVDRSGRSRTRSFRQAFLLSFASRIGERLRTANRAAATDAATTFGDTFLPVLAGRNDQVEELTTRVFPKVSFRRSSVSNASGWAAGREAADRATIELAKAPISRT